MSPKYIHKKFYINTKMEKPLNKYIKNGYRESAFSRLMDSISNRRLIQYLRLELFKEIDIQPKYLEEENLLNSKYMDDTFFHIKNTSELILELLEEQVLIYTIFFSKSNISWKTSVRDMLLPGEEDKFTWEKHYRKWLRKFYDDEKRIVIDPIGYHQKLYDFIIRDLTYGDVYDHINIVE